MSMGVNWIKVWGTVGCGWLTITAAAAWAVR